MEYKVIDIHTVRFTSEDDIDEMEFPEGYVDEELTEGQYYFEIMSHGYGLTLVECVSVWQSEIEVTGKRVIKSK